MRRLGLMLALLATSLLRIAPAEAVPESGLYYQPIPGSSGNLQAGIPSGVLQIDYAPVLDRPGSGQMQLLQAALRLPAPLLDSPLSLNGLLGYRHLWAFYGESALDHTGGIELGLSAVLPFSAIAGYDSPLAPFGLYAFGFHHQLLLAAAQGNSFSPVGTALRSYGAGLTFRLPTNGVLVLGLESWAIPQGLGSGATSFGSAVRDFNGFIVGYRW